MWYHISCWNKYLALYKGAWVGHACMLWDNISHSFDWSFVFHIIFQKIISFISKFKVSMFLCSVCWFMCTLWLMYWVNIFVYLELLTANWYGHRCNALVYFSPWSQHSFPLDKHNHMISWRYWIMTHLRRIDYVSLAKMVN